MDSYDENKKVRGWVQQAQWYMSRLHVPIATVVLFNRDTIMKLARGDQKTYRKDIVAEYPLDFDQNIILEILAKTALVRQHVEAGTTPPPEFGEDCNWCPFQSFCMTEKEV